MKLSAITSRSLQKDYVDLYFIVRQVSLDELLSAAKSKLPTLNLNLALKSLTYFDDIIEEPIVFKGEETPSLDTIRRTLNAKVIEVMDRRIG